MNWKRIILAGLVAGLVINVSEAILNPDFHFHVSFANLSSTFDAFIDEGWKALKALRRSTPHG